MRGWVIIEMIEIWSKGQVRGRWYSMGSKGHLGGRRFYSMGSKGKVRGTWWYSMGSKDQVRGRWW